VNKGEKGILILAPIVQRKNESAEQNETGESSAAVGFQAAYVFDISQTDGQVLPAIESVNCGPREYRERLAKFVVEQGIALEYSEDSVLDLTSHPSRLVTIKLLLSDCPEFLKGAVTHIRPRPNTSACALI
jgi:hypothetical protein